MSAQLTALKECIDREKAEANKLIENAVTRGKHYNINTRCDADMLIGHAIVRVLDKLIEIYEEK